MALNFAQQEFEIRTHENKKKTCSTRQPRIDLHVNDANDDDNDENGFPFLWVLLLRLFCSNARLN